MEEHLLHLFLFEDLNLLIMHHQLLRLLEEHRFEHFILVLRIVSLMYGDLRFLEGHWGVRHAEGGLQLLSVQQRTLPFLRSPDNQPFQVLRLAAVRSLFSDHFLDLLGQRLLRKRLAQRQSHGFRRRRVRCFVQMDLLSVDEISLLSYVHDLSLLVLQQVGRFFIVCDVRKEENTGVRLLVDILFALLLFPFICEDL